MLNDPAFPQALVDNFAGQWLHLRNLQSLLPNSDEFPDFDDNLRQSLQRETEMFFESILREDRECHRTADRRLHLPGMNGSRGTMGITDIYGSRFRQASR